MNQLPIPLLLFIGLIGTSLAISCYRETQLPTLNKDETVECDPGCDFCVSHRIIKPTGVQFERHCGCGDSKTLLGSLVNCKGVGVFPYQLMDATITKTCCQGDFCNGGANDEKPDQDQDQAPVVKKKATTTTTTTTLRPILPRSLPPIPIIVPTVVTIQPILPGSATPIPYLLSFILAFFAIIH